MTDRKYHYLSSVSKCWQGVGSQTLVSLRYGREFEIQSFGVKFDIQITDQVISIPDLQSFFPIVQWFLVVLVKLLSATVSIVRS